MRRRVSVPATFLATWSVVAGASAQPYTIIDLGTLTDRTSVAYTLNGSAQVAGASAVSGGSKVISIDPYVVEAEPWFVHAFLWSDGSMKDLGVLGPDVPPGTFPKPDSMAFAMNDAGQVVGRSNQPFGKFEGFLWLPEPAFGMPAGMHKLPELPEGATQLYDINSAGQIVGESRPAGSIGPRAVLWQFVGGAWTLTDLGDLGGPYARAYGVNDLGQIVGHSNAPSSFKSFLWLPEPAYGLPAGMNLIAGQFTDTTGFKINRQGQVIGSIGAFGAFIWLPAPAYGLPAGATQLDPTQIPTGGAAGASGINNHGVVVGQVGLLKPKPGGGFTIAWDAMIWQNGQMKQLETLLPAGSGWDLVAANDVNDLGQIVGWGFPPGEVEKGHAFLMTPVLCKADLDDDGDTDQSDLGILLASYGSGPGGDLDGDGDTDQSDLGVLLADFGCR
jgi:uncharacterized membrane protein